MCTEISVCFFFKISGLSLPDGPHNKDYYYTGVDIGVPLSMETSIYDREQKRMSLPRD